MQVIIYLQSLLRSLGYVIANGQNIAKHTHFILNVSLLLEYLRVDMKSVTP